MRSKGDAFNPVHVVSRGGVWAYRFKGWPSGTYRTLGIPDTGKKSEVAANEKAWAEYRKDEELRTGGITLRTYGALFYGAKCPHTPNSIASGKPITDRVKKNNRARFKNHLAELSIMTKKVQAITSIDVGIARKEIVSADISERWKKLKEKNPAASQPTTTSREAQNRFILLRTILRTAYRDGLMAKDPLLNVPTINYKPKERRELDPGQTVDLFTREAFPDDMGWAVFRLAYLTGMRRAEVLAFEWDQIKKRGDSWTIVVDRAWKDDNFKEIGLPKWGKTRDIPVTSELKELLTWWQGLNPFARTGLVFHGVDGGPLSTNWWKLHFKEAKKVAKLGAEFVPHSLRHTLASDLSSAGVPADTIRGALGWTTEKMRDNYTHMNADRMRDAMEAGMRKIAGK